MNITWYAQSCFKLQSKDVVLITDSFDKKIGFKPPFGAADIVTISHDHYDHNNSQVIKGKPFIIDGEGEYEIKKVSVKGIESCHDNNKGADLGFNTIYVIEIEDINICHLGDIGQETLTNGQLEKIGRVDLLFIPIGGVSTIDWKSANNIISQIDPRIIIPMHYKIPGGVGDLKKLDDREKFCKEHGVQNNDIVEKFNIKKKDLPQEDVKIVILKPVGK
ncbi:MAG: MBL fold metallo-hydrolase [Candidatus Pacebacteria bacterium]|nr:MBL fold metallo-hydrolase [Candidatus Paceibacterota bacterium]